jgi:hypothetical protein
VRACIEPTIPKCQASLEKLCTSSDGRRKVLMIKFRRVAAWVALVVAGVGLGRAAADEKFSTSVPRGEFSAAGLTKLSPEELARLDALVRDFKSGALARAQREAAAAAKAQADAEAKAARVEAEAKAAQAEAEAKAARAEAGRRAAEADAQARTAAAAKAKVESAPAKAAAETAPPTGTVTVAPGTKVEFSTVESRIAGSFNGWEARTVFTLENGQRWRNMSNDSYVTSPVPSPAVRIVPGILGTFWMTVEGVKQRVKVAPVVAK